MEKIKKVKLHQLKPFKNHPFSVQIDKQFIELMRSIDEEGIMVPLLARPNPDGEGYELISGYRRKMACSELGMDEVPVIIRELDDNQAAIAMVDINLMQREVIKPSEKAFALRTKLEAMNKQGQRNDLTSGQLDQKLNPTLVVYGAEVEKKDNEGLVFYNTEIKYSQFSARKELANQIGESEKQVQRYIRLTYLIPQILKMVDEERIAFTVAVELSYLKEDEQYELYAVMDLEQCTPSRTQAHRMKILSQQDRLDMDEIYEILEEEKPNQKEKIKIPADLLDEFFPEGYTEKQKIELIQKLVEKWYLEQDMSEIKVQKR